MGSFAARRHAHVAIVAYIAAVAFVAVLGVIGLERGARGASMDPSPERLVLQPPGRPSGATCQSIAADPESALSAGKSPNVFPCRPDNVAFRNMVSELGFAIAPNAFHPARTTGLGGFALTLEASFTKINSSSLSKASDGTSTSYWQRGTEGARDATTQAAATTNSNPDALIQIYSLKARKASPTASSSRARSATSRTPRFGSGAPTCAGRCSKAFAPARSASFLTSRSAAACGR